MKYKLILDNKKRKLFKKYEIKQLYYKIGIRLKRKLKLNIIIRLSHLVKNSNIACIKNRCFISGRSNAVYNKLSISRIKFRNILLHGLTPGFKKSSW